MPRRLVVGAVGVVVLAAAGCGGSESAATKTTTTLTASRLADLRDASLSATGDTSEYCADWVAGVSPDRARVTDAVNRLADAYRASRWAPAIREDVRETATTLRDCGEESQADRLDRLADEH